MELLTPEVLSSELKSLKKDLTRQFRGGEWDALAGSLEALAKLSEGQGAREICLRAQSLREIMGNRGSGRIEAGNRVTELFDELLFQVSHLQWLSQTSH